MKKITIGPVANLVEAIRGDLEARSQSSIDKRLVYSLAECASCALISQSVNSYDWMPVLPRDSKKKSKELFIRRTLSNPTICTANIMSFYVPEVIEKLAAKGKIVVLMMDQSQIYGNLQVLMVSVRFGSRAIPVLWKVEKTGGNIGFETQKELLDQVFPMIPKGVRILFLGDRFYGTKCLIEWCKNANWYYEIRIKGNLIFEHEGGEITAVEVGGLRGSRAIGARFSNSDVVTNIGYLHENGHREPWIIAMSCEPTKYKILDYGMRWGIESMFSDFKSRGFGITDTHIRKTDRLERLILILTIGLYWAVSVGMDQDEDELKMTFKKNRDHDVLCSKTESD